MIIIAEPIMVIIPPITRLIFLEMCANDTLVNIAPMIAETDGIPTSNICIMPGLKDTFHLCFKTKFDKDEVWDKANPIKIPENAIIDATPNEWQ